MDNFQVRIDDGSNDRILPLHQEMAQMSLLNLTIWIPLQDINTGGIGGLTFVPGSHKKGFVKHQLYKVPATYYGIKEDTYSKGELEYPTFKAGDAFIFHPLLMHGSVPNVSNNVRWTLVGRVNDITELNYIKNDAAELKYPTDRNEPVYKQYNRLIKWEKLF